MPYGYDDNGNLTSDGSTAFVYDVENRLVQASGAKNASLRYDLLGRLYEVSGGGLGTRLFLHDGDALVAEYNGSGALAHRYVHGGAEGVDDPLVWYDGGVARWLHADHQGSIVAVTDGAGGSPTINAYDEYGVPKATNVGRFQYTGQAWIPELGMYHYKARVYAPKLGRFLQVDPIGYRSQINLYAYAGNDPVNARDHSGLYECVEKECGEIETARRKIEAARDRLRNATGTRIPSRAAGDLTKVLRTIGTENDDNGLKIRLGSAGGDYGQFDPNTNTITLDNALIERTPQKSLAGVLAHEGSHAYDHEHGIPYNKFPSEIKANAIKAMYEVGSGTHGEFYRPGIGPDELVRRIKQSGMGYCFVGGAAAQDCIDAINKIHPNVPITR